MRREKRNGAERRRTAPSVDWRAIPPRARARDWQLRLGGSQWCRGKSFDTFSPLGPCLVTADEIAQPNALGIRTVLNGETVQDWNTNDMIFDIPALIEFLSGSSTLLPGTVIMTGTPHGVDMAAKPPRWLKAGDTVSIEIDGIGRMVVNQVRLRRGQSLRLEIS
jgi:2-keto-4-pentenoate hydratase/2-oxohepta-3-ene-1,7-dioic acid hydratase in catechol pathway